MSTTPVSPDPVLPEAMPPGASPLLAPVALPVSLYRAAKVRELDRIAIEEHGIEGFTLMCRAAEAAFRLLIAKWPTVGKLAVFCGAGNNGGDGYVVAALARRHGLDVRVCMAAEESRLRGDARRAWQMAVDEGVAMQPCTAPVDDPPELVIDALLGTGLAGPVRDNYAAIIDSINASGKPVLALDIPSGLCSDTGAILGTAVRADHTISFIGMKQGLLTGKGRSVVGTLHYDALQVPAAIFEAIDRDSERLDCGLLPGLLPRRPRDAHKGAYGHVMVIGGGAGMGGAVVMAARAALRSGAGLVSVATWPAHHAGVLAQVPEAMVHGVGSGQELEPLLAAASVLVVGPGLGKTPWSEQLLQKAAASGLPMVVDADALNIIAAGRVLRDLPRDNWILTPHPGEAARLLGADNPALQADRFDAAAQLQQRYGGVVVLKGSGTLVAAEKGSVGVCPYGNPGMASGGMGDVLSGVTGGLLGQGLDLEGAARAAVCIHSRAADLAAAEYGERGLCATDLMPWIRRLVNPDRVGL